MDRHRACRDDRDLALVELVAVAIGAMEGASAPALGQPLDVRQAVLDAGCKEQASALEGRTVGGGDDEGVLLAAGGHGAALDPDERRIGGELRPRGCGDLAGRDAVLAEEAMGVAGKPVAANALVDDSHAPAGAQKLEGGGHAGIAAAYDDDVLLHRSSPFGCARTSPPVHGTSASTRAFGQ
ncbi:hypothetical protein D9M70_445340 [compost metagenome]